MARLQGHGGGSSRDSGDTPGDGDDDEWDLCTVQKEAAGVVMSLILFSISDPLYHSIWFLLTTEAECEQEPTPCSSGDHSNGGVMGQHSPVFHSGIQLMN